MKHACFRDRPRRPLVELDDPIVRGQLQLDRMWQARLDARAAARRRALGDLPGGEDAESGAYDPMQRFATEKVGWGKV